jgi:hypothetical protein
VGKSAIFAAAERSVEVEVRKSLWRKEFQVDELAKMSTAASSELNVTLIACAKKILAQ